MELIENLLGDITNQEVEILRHLATVLQDVNTEDGAMKVVCCNGYDPLVDIVIAEAEHLKRLEASYGTIEALGEKFAEESPVEYVEIEVLQNPVEDDEVVEEVLSTGDDEDEENDDNEID